ncbi:hypothetical protein, partial [Bacillus thuringiensis]|uniref:hypothetical protein n=1 Tax=Bacillus thuringiensis TaxID=1428 RepID=UPI0038838614
QLCIVDHPIGFEFESSLIWFAGALLEVMEPNSGLEFATLHDLSAMERDWFEEDIRTLLDAENMTYMYEDEVRNNVILEVW